MSKNVPVEIDVLVMTRDNSLLRADIYRPDDNGKHPAIIQRTPYEKLSTLESTYSHYLPVGLAANE